MTETSYSEIVRLDYDLFKIMYDRVWAYIQVKWVTSIPTNVRAYLLVRDRGLNVNQAELYSNGWL